MEQIGTEGSSPKAAPKRDRAAYMREYRSRKPVAARHIEIPVEMRGTSDDVMCPLCGEVFETGAAYIKHYKQTRWGPDEVHQCLSRDEMRQAGTLVQNWESGSWKVRH